MWRGGEGGGRGLGTSRMFRHQCRGKIFRTPLASGANLVYMNIKVRTVSWVLWRVPGLPIGDCWTGYNNWGHTRPQMSATNMTGKTFFERLYLVQGLGVFGPWVDCPCAPTTPTIHCTTISRFFVQSFSTKGPLIFLVSTIHEVIWPSPGTLVLRDQLGTNHQSIVQWLAWVFQTKVTKKERGWMSNKPAAPAGFLEVSGRYLLVLLPYFFFWRDLFLELGFFSRLRTRRTKVYGTNRTKERESE